jgi:hypothetical protein
MNTTRTEPVIGSRFSPTIQTHMKKQKGMKKHTHNKQGLSSRTALTRQQKLDLRPCQDELFWRQSGTLVLHWSRQIGKSFVLASVFIRVHPWLLTNLAVYRCRFQGTEKNAFSHPNG